MKKRFILFSLLVLLLILPSCGSMLDQAQENQSHPAPPILTISSMDKFEQFVALPSYSDEAIEEFLSTDEYFAGCLIDTRKGVNMVLDPLFAVGYPYVEERDEVGRFNFAYYDGEHRYNFYYQIDGIIYQFQYTKYESEVKHYFKKPACTVELDGHTLSLYYAKNSNGLVGQIYKDGYEILVSVREYEDIDDISFGQFRLYPEN